MRDKFSSDEDVVDTIFPQTETANKNDDDVSFYAETKDNFKHLFTCAKKIGYFNQSKKEEKETLKQILK